MARQGIIYQYTNLINGKVYIGQTTTSLETRHKKHLSQLNDNTYFHRAIKKYGIENFNLIILEQDIPLEILDEREIYWIKEKDAYYRSGKGYNLTKGGQWSNSTQKLTGKQVEEIQQLLATTTRNLADIGTQYQVSLSCISDINRGKTFHDSMLNYPIRPAVERSYLNMEIVDNILNLLLTTDKTQDEIAELCNVKAYTVGEINRGNNSWCPLDLVYPLRKPIQAYTYNNKIQQNDVVEIIKELIYTNTKIEDIASKYGLKKNTVGDISRGISWKDITQQFVCPIRKNKKENIPIYQSIYGIV